VHFLGIGAAPEGSTQAAAAAAAAAATTRGKMAASSSSALVPARKADFAALIGDTRLADVTITIKIKADEETAEQGRKAAVGAPAAKRARTDEGGGGMAGQQPFRGHVNGGRVVATLQVHSVVLVQRSPYFQGLLLGAGAAMVEGQGKTLTVELEDEQGGFGWVGWSIVSFTNHWNSNHTPNQHNHRGGRLQAPNQTRTWLRMSTSPPTAGA
jgi:hypothetical protein